MKDFSPPPVIQQVITTLDFLSVCSVPVRSIFAYWDRQRGARRMPSRRDIEPADLSGHLPGVVIVDVQQKPLDFIYRLVGTREVEARGYDPSGKRVAEHFFGGDAEAVLSNYRYVAAQGTFLYEFERFLDKQGHYRTDETLFLPLSTDDRTVTQILTYSHYDDIWRRRV
jgi:hypothetical protein